MAENFTQVIARVLGTDINSIPAVKGRYQVRKGPMIIDRSDLDTFQKLFTAAPAVGGKTVGNGEVSLYWLFNWQKPMSNPMSPTVAKETRGDNQPDLMISRRAVEVKAYKTHTGLTSLGRFGSQRAFLDMVNKIFGVRNLFNDEPVNRVDINNFNFNKLAEASELFCEFRTLIFSSSRLQDYKLFKKAYTNMVAFDNTARREGLSSICYSSTGSRPGGEAIAYELSRYVIKQLLEGKPGEGNFIANMIPNNVNGFQQDKGVYFHQITLDSMTTDTNVLNTAFKFEGGSLKLSYKRLFD